MGGTHTDELPPVDAIDPGVLADLRRLVVWQCQAPDQSTIGIRRPLADALDASGLLLDALGLTPAEAASRIDEVLPQEPGNRSTVGIRLFAVRAMLGLLDPLPSYDTPVLGVEGLRLGDASGGARSIAELGYRYDTHLAVRKAFVIRVFGGIEPSGLKLTSPAATEMARALAWALGLAGERGSFAAQTARRSLLRDQLAARLDVHAPPYPPHLTPSVLAKPLTVSFERPDARNTEESSSHGVPIRRVLRRHRRVVVRGAPGGGKSTVLTGAVLGRLKRGRPALAVRLPDIAQKLSLHGVPTSLDAAVKLLVELTRYELGVALEEDRQSVASLATDEDALLALDGLDEVDPAEMARVRTYLQVLDSFGGSILLSSRIVGYVAPPGSWRHVSVDALPDGYAAAFLKDWFSGREKQARTRAIRALKARELRSMSTSPVLLGVIATVAEQEAVPRARGELYDRYVARLLERPWRLDKGHGADVTDLFDRRRAATQLAWFTATGGSGNADEGRWTDLVSMADVASRAAAVDSAAAQSLLTNDALLVPYGRSESRLHQRHVWVHRTIQEHLVGAYLAGQADVSPTWWDDQLLRLILGPERWLEPLRHMTRLLSESGLVRLFESLQAFESGPADQLAEDTLAQLVAVLPEESAMRPRLAYWLVSRGQWGHVQELNLALWMDKWPDALLSGEADATDLWDIAKVTRSDPEWLPSVVARYEVSPNRNDELYVEMLGELARRRPGVAMRHYADALEAGSFVSFPSIYARRRFEPDLAKDLVSRAGQMDPERRLLLLDALSELGVFRGREGRAIAALIDPIDWELLQHLEAYSKGHLATTVLNPVALEALLRAARGDYGTPAAFDLGYAPQFSAFELDETMPYAQLGEAARRLWAATPVAQPDAKVARAIEELLAVSEADTLDADRALGLLEATIECVHGASRIRASTALELYRRVLVLDNQFELGPHADTVEHEVTKFIRDGVVEVINAHDVESVLEELLASDPRAWPEDAHNPGTLDLAALLGVDGTRLGGPSVNPRDLVAVTAWAATGGSSVLSGMRPIYFDDQAEEIAALLSATSPSSVALRGNAMWFVDHLRDQGLLYRWRGPVLELDD